MKNFPGSPVAMIESIWNHRRLIKASVQREIVGRYRGSILGGAWSILLPVFMLAVYTFVFSDIFKARWGTHDSKTDFALILYSGLIVFNIFSDCVGRSVGVIVSNINFVKKVVFPLEILPIVVLLTAVYHALLSWLVWLIAYVVVIGWPSWGILGFPLVFMPFCIFLSGIAWFLAALGVYVRDVAQFMPVAISVTLFLSPVFYSIEAVPEKYRNFIYLNPLAIFIEQTRNVLFFADFPATGNMLMLWGLAISSAIFGFLFFQKTRRGFADVL